MDDETIGSVDYRVLSSQRLNADLYGSEPVALREIHSSTATHEADGYIHECQIANANLKNKKLDCDMLSRLVNDYPHAEYFVLSEANYKREIRGEALQQKSKAIATEVVIGMNSFHKIETNGVVILAGLTDVNLKEEQLDITISNRLISLKLKTSQIRPSWCLQQLAL